MQSIQFERISLPADTPCMPRAASLNAKLRINSRIKWNETQLHTTIYSIRKQIDKNKQSETMTDTSLTFNKKTRMTDELSFAIQWLSCNSSFSYRIFKTVNGPQYHHHRHHHYHHYHQYSIPALCYQHPSRLSILNTSKLVFTFM